MLTRTRSIAAAAFVLAAWAAVLAQSDFGDAPDGVTASYPGFPGVLGRYPTLPTTSSTRFPGNVGIEHDATTAIVLGGASSVTTLEAVPEVTDLDVDDSGAYVWISLTGIPSGAILTVPVTIAPEAAEGPYFLNVLIDQNNDGEWKDTPSLREWAVRDRPIDQAPGTTMRHSVPVWWSSSLMLLPKWVRITVSDVPVAGLMTWGSDGWDGSMPPGSPLALAVGETEDRFLGGVYPGTAGPGGGPLPGPPGGGVPGGAGGGAPGKGVVGGPAAPGACKMSVRCRPKDQTIPCPGSGSVTCTVKYLSGSCPTKISFGNGDQCNAIIEPKFVKRHRGAGPRLVVTPPWECTEVGPGMRTVDITFTASFPQPCTNPFREETWSFALQIDPEGIYDTVAPDEHESIVLSSTPFTCGNGVPQPPSESCDDGNTVSGDTCASDCQFPTYVANGILGPGEDCDDGNTVAGDGCSAFGIREHCGNGRLDPHETCDDGNTLDGDACNHFCQPSAATTCPNGTVDHELEQCDDGNAIDGDGCDAYCQIEICGDGTVDAGEQCDDANDEGGDGCSATCQSEGTCGNGWLDAGEECDDGGTFPEDGCGAGCTLAAPRVRSLRVADDRTTLAWEAAVAPLRAYDVLRGDLAELLASDGDIGQPASACLATAHATERIEDTTEPGPGEVLWYLVRVSRNRPAPGSWEPSAPATGAVGGRDVRVTPCD
jgi:cysteine-rich repeat protein